MKKLTVFFIVFGFVLALPVLKLHAQKPFEGTITWSMTMPQMGDEESHPMIVNVKGDKNESEMDMGAMESVKTYSDPATKKTYMVMGAMKMGYVMDMNDPDAKNATQKMLDSLELKPTGQKATIAGHAAEEYLLTGIKSRGTTLDMSIWVASDFPKDIQESFYNSMKNKPGQDLKQMQALKQFADRGLVPVRIVAKMGDEVAMSMEFVKYEQKKLDDALFVPPAGIKFNPFPKGAGMN